MFKDAAPKSKTPVNFGIRQGLSVIWRFLSFGIGVDLVTFFIAVPVILALIIFAPDKVQAALNFFK